MFRNMRRWKQELPIEESYEILKKESCGVLALQGDGGYPYAVPLSYVFDGKKIYFHSAPMGHKIDAICRDSKASFCVVAEDNVIEEKFTTAFISVIVFGKIHVIEEMAEKRMAIETLGRKYSPGRDKEMAKEIEGSFHRLCIISLTPEHITGKEGIELTNMRKV